MTLNIIATQVWRYFGTVLKSSGRTNLPVGVATVDPPGGGGTTPAPTFMTWTPGAVMPLGTGESLPADAANDVWSPLALSGAPVGFQVGAHPEIVALTRYDNAITLVNGHPPYENLDIYARVTGRCTTSLTVPTHVCLRNCIVRGNAGQLSEPITGSNLTNDYCAAGTSFDFGAAVFEWVSFDCTGRTYITKDAIDGGGYTARYCEARGGVDGFGINKAGNVTLLNCRSWDNTYYAYKNTSTNPATSYVEPHQASYNSHNDGCQIQTGRNINILGSFLGGTPYLNSTTIQNANLDPGVPEQYAVIQQVRQGTDANNSAIIFNSVAGGGNIQVTVRYNWVAGGSARMNVGARDYTDKMSEVTITDNKFFRTILASPRITSPGYDILAISDNQATMARNTYAHNGSPITVTTYA